MQGCVRIKPRRSKACVAAELVDVSAGGLCAEATPPMRLSAGSAVDIEIRMPMDGAARCGADLRGTAVLLRLDGAGDKARAILRFVEPLELQQPFLHLAVGRPD